jgi:hypothetical protein
MGPSEIQELIESQPFVPLRLTLSSGSVVEIRADMDVNIVGLSLSVVDELPEFGQRLRFVSIPNIAIAEPMAGPMRPGATR